ncbi:MAG: hypothetical protein GF408_08465 [Candidatus Omnitrophica bacterium]|nr:hypothetical protein [Candidatus Omnitrophota bacterium]
MEEMIYEPAVAEDERLVGGEGSVAEAVPIKPPLRVVDHRTINKKFGWWAAVVMIESYAKKQVCFYLWQKKDGTWKRKQKFGIHSKSDWKKMKEAVDSFAEELDD